MENQRTHTIVSQQSPSAFTGFGDVNSQERLNVILSANARIADEKRLYRTEQEQFEAALIKNPIPVKKAFAYFGLLLGIFPPASIFIKLFHGGKDEIGLAVLLLFVNIICAIVGYFSGRLIGKMVLEMENRSWSLMLLALPFIGIFWGIVTGGAGGIFILIIGAFFGAFIASMVGSVAVTAFTIFHRLLKKGEVIERNHFLPLAFGITFIISAFILGL